MVRATLSWWLSIPLLLVLLGSSAAQQARPKPATEKPPAKHPALLDAKPAKEEPGDDELRKLLKARYNEAVAEVQGNYAMFQLARAEFIALADSASRLVASALELTDKPAERVAILEQYVELLKMIEEVIEAKKLAARATGYDVNKARYQRLDAEIRLLRARREANKGK